MHFVALVFSTASALGSIWLLSQSRWKLISKVFFSLGSFFWLNATGLWIFADYFTGKGVDDSVIFHLAYGMAGAGFGEFTAVIIAAILYFVAAMSATIFVFIILGNRPSKRKSGIAALSILLIPLSITAHPLAWDFYRMYGNGLLIQNAVSGKDLSRQYKIPVLTTRLSEAELPNIVFLYLESLERTYFNESIFPGLITGLKTIERNSLTFTDIIQLQGTDFTIAGMTASQCGIPLLVNFNGNAMSSMDQFLPGAYCLGDVLNNLGYELSYIGGANLEFQGKGKFYESHGFKNIDGRTNLQPSLDNPDEVSWWGLYDDSLFDIALNRLRENDSNKPFGLFLLTLDTHQPSGHPSPSCSNLKYRDGANPILNAVRCTDHLASAFIHKIRKSAWGKNTIIVVASDHLALKNTATDDLNSVKRRNLFFINFPINEEIGEIQRKGSMLDVTPTLLDVLGFEQTELGLGKSLLANTPTLAESNDANAILNRFREKIVELMNFPDISLGLALSDDSKITIGPRKLVPPALFLLDENSSVNQILFEPYFLQGDLGVRLSRMSAETKFLWVDSCRYAWAFEPNYHEYPDASWCIFSGQLGSAPILIQELAGKFIKRRDITEILASARSDDNLYQQQTDALRVIGSTGIGKIDEFVIPEMGGSSTDIIVVSSGNPDLPSSVLIFSPDNIIQTLLFRGLTLLELDSANISIKELGRIDVVDDRLDDSEIESFLEKIRRATSIAESQYVLLIAHDSLISHLSRSHKTFSRLSEIFTNMEAMHFQTVHFREPYILILKGNKVVYESKGSKETRLAVRLKNS